jgi:asparagine synthase (glutamine-hydrolysing)
MCGICGYIKLNGPVGYEDKPIIDMMNKKLVHRGPDAQDSILFDNVAFGFSRLSIIGLGNGMQPIYNESRSLVLMCNGEIFNYIELKKELLSRGHAFATESDVEVIVHLYEEYGFEFLNKLNGQFSFVLYDMEKRQLFCARDQLGINPFFYTKVNGLFVFGSEIKAILEHPLVPKEVDLVGLDQVFTFAGLISPKTMFKHISSLENGHYLIVDASGRIEKAEYWDLIYPEGNEDTSGMSETDYADKLEELFEASVEMRLRADVPSGIYLSGGLDSSMIAMKVNKFQPERDKQAFSIDFIDSRHSESNYQKLVAEEAGFQLNQKTFFYTDISERLRDVIYHCECPIKETYNAASLSLSESVRARGIKVILSGEGSDELFAGYVGYRFDQMRDSNLMQTPSDPAEDAIREMLWTDKSLFYERNFLEFEQIKKELYSTEANAVFEDFNCLNHFVINSERLVNRNKTNKRSYIDYKLRMVDHLISDHGDRMALANSIEVRYPFLDKDFVEFSTRVPASLKIKDFTEKYILKKMAGRFTNSKICNREKFGFIAPGSPYLLKKDIEYINDILSYDLIKKQGYFNPDRIETLKKEYLQDGFAINAPFESDLLIIVITFGIFLDKFFSA